MIKYITLELRPRLQICNTFICFKREVNSRINIRLAEDCIEVRVDGRAIKFLMDFVKLIPSSLTSLSIAKNWVCFRAQTKSATISGSFRTEVITNSASSISPSNSSLNNTELLEANKCNIACSCCKNVLTNEIWVKRVLPVPDTLYDPSEWFCCKHNHDSTMPDLTPSEFEIFYGSVFFVVHKNVFNESLKMNGDNAVCSRCLQHVGKFHSKSSFKLWSCAIEYNLPNGAQIKSATDLVNDFLNAVKSSITGVFGEEIVLQSFIGKDMHSLFIKPMDWHLNVMTEPEEFQWNKPVTLRKVSVVKVLYKYDTNKTVIDSINRTCCEVSFLVLKTGLEHLLRSTKRFPSIHRTASDFYIGYICLENS